MRSRSFVIQGTSEVPSTTRGYIRLYSNGKKSHYKRFWVTAISDKGDVVFDLKIGSARTAYVTIGLLAATFPKMDYDETRQFSRDQFRTHVSQARISNAEN